MNHRDRFFAALDLSEPDYVPVTDLGLDPLVVKGIQTREQIQSHSNYISTSPVDRFWESTIDRRLDMFDACVRLDFDAAPVMSDYDACTKTFEPRFIDQKRFVDQWGRIMQESKEGKTTYFVDGIVNNSRDLDHYAPPNAFDSDILEMIAVIMKQARNTDIVMMGECHSGWHLGFQVRGGIEKIAIDLYRNPVFARDLLDKLAEASQAFARAYIEAGVDVLVVTDDYADNHGPLINPRLFREFELPNLQKIVDIGKKHGVPVLKHSDGNLYPILDDIIGTGISGLHPIEPGAMELRGFKEKFGRSVCILGNVDCRHVLPYGTEQDVRLDVRRCIDDAGKGGGFVLASSNSIHGNVKVDNVYTMVDEARKYGKYPLKVNE